MLTFLQFLAEQYLEEKLIMYNQGKRYGQIVFLAGGAGSGNGFAVKHFMEKEKFKLRDDDEGEILKTFDSFDSEDDLEEQRIIERMEDPEEEILLN